MAFQLFYVNFTIAFLLTGFAVGCIGGSVGTGGERYGFEMSYFDEIAGGRAGPCYLWAISGGVIWNVANILLCKGIGMMGNAVGFPLCVGLGMVTGAVVGYANDPKSNLALLVPGIGVALCGIFAVGFLSYLKERELDESDSDGSEDGSASALNCDFVDESISDSDASVALTAEAGMFKKLVVCIVGGLFLGLSNIGVGRATSVPCNLSPYGNQTYFSIGVFLSSLVLVPLITRMPLEGGKGRSIFDVLAEYPGVSTRDHLLAALGGVILCAGFFFFNLGNKPLGLTITYCIGQSAPLVGILWGTFFFREFAGTSIRVWGLVPVVCICFATAIVLIAAAG
mmetsp:Transcript_108176/g.304736  ORF Transcript_108176/g.304736 Transcript_108176/m.304736 type:complete len:340 (-) Transcript_108176:110-1129(-)